MYDKVLITEVVALKSVTGKLTYTVCSNYGVYDVELRVKLYNTKWRCPTTKKKFIGLERLIRYMHKHGGQTTH